MLSLISLSEEKTENLIFPARTYRCVDILVLDGKIARIIHTADTTRRIGDDAEPLLAVLAPSTDQTVLLPRLHDISPSRIFTHSCKK